VRASDQHTVVIRVPLGERDLLLETYPDSFGVRPRMEAHHKVEAYLDRADRVPCARPSILPVRCSEAEPVTAQAVVFDRCRS
jgi:hypothetical protein